MAERRHELAKSVRTGSFKTNYHDVGGGFPVTLLHGSGPGASAWANWNKLFTLLKDDFRLIAPDLSGFGFTERVKGRVETMDGWAEQIVDLLDALGIEKTNLAGSSFGGALALALAVRKPGRVNKIALAGSMGVSFPVTYGLERVWGYEPSLENMEELLELFTYDRRFAARELARSCYEASIRPGFQESFRALFPEPRQKWVDAMAENQRCLRNIPHETLIVHGREDRIVPLESSYKLLQLIDRAELHVFGRCGHWIQIERARDFADLLRSFFKR